MAVVPIDFIPPLEPDITVLNIWESATPTGTFVLIDTVTPVGTYPNYITRYVTQAALSATDWFAISWVDSKGAESDLSAPVKGGTKTLVGEIVDRVLLRDPFLNENVVAQEAEAAIFLYFKKDPYSINVEAVSFTIISGLTDYVLAASKYLTIIGSVTSTESYTAGAVSERSTNTVQSLNAIEALEKRAMKKLGLMVSVIARIKDSPELTQQVIMIDRSRLLGVGAIKEIVLFDVE